MTNSVYNPIIITVVNENGEPIADAFIEVLLSKYPMPEIALLTNNRGEAIIRLRPGPYLFGANKGSRSGETEVTITDDIDSTQCAVTIELSVHSSD